MPLVPSRRSALDLGCGTGTKATAYVAREFDAVIAVDISARSIEVARQRVPGVEFLAGDMTRVEFPAEAFDLVTAFYSVLHVPAGEQSGLVARVASWLVPGGVFLFNVGLGAGDQQEDDWLGAPMFFSGLDEETNERLISEAGLTILESHAERMEEPESEPGRGRVLVSFHWILARRDA